MGGKTGQFPPQKQLGGPNPSTMWQPQQQEPLWQPDPQRQATSWEGGIPRWELTSKDRQNYLNQQLQGLFQGLGKK